MATEAEREGEETEVVGEGEEGVREEATTEAT